LNRKNEVLELFQQAYRLSTSCQSALCLSCSSSVIPASSSMASEAEPTEPTGDASDNLPALSENREKKSCYILHNVLLFSIRFRVISCTYQKPNNK
jgi:hypothetical protein